MKLFFVLSGALAVFGCATPNRLTISDSDKFRAAVEQSIPIGTSVDEARKMLEAQAFQCLVPYGERSLETPTGNLVCIRSGTPLGSLVEHDWRVEIFVDGQKAVSKVVTKVSATLI